MASDALVDPAGGRVRDGSARRGTARVAVGEDLRARNALRNRYGDRRRRGYGGVLLRLGPVLRQYAPREDSRMCTDDDAVRLGRGSAPARRDAEANRILQSDV